MARVRLLFVIAGLGRAGAEKQLYLLLKHLDRDAFAPTVVSLSAGGAWVAPIRALGVPVTELPRRHSLEGQRLLGLYRQVRRSAPDILQTVLFPDLAYGLLAGRLARVPVLIASRRIDHYGDGRPVLRAVNRLLLPLADAVICNARRSLRYVPRALAARCAVIPNGVEPVIPARRRADVRHGLDLPADIPVVGTVGRLMPQKNHRLFLQVASDVLRSRPRAAFLLVGGGPLEAELRRQAGEPGLAGRVALTGERADVADLLGAMDVFLLTSEREGMSNALMEAMTLGLPCVATDAGGSAEVVAHGETGYVCPRGDRGSLAGHVGALLDDPGLRGRLGAAGRRRAVTGFAPDAMARATETLYRRLLDGRAGPPPSDAVSWTEAEGTG